MVAGGPGLGFVTHLFFKAQGEKNRLDLWTLWGLIQSWNFLALSKILQYIVFLPVLPKPLENISTRSHIRIFHKKVNKAKPYVGAEIIQPRKLLK